VAEPPDRTAAQAAEGVFDAEEVDDESPDEEPDEPEEEDADDFAGPLAELVPASLVSFVAEPLLPASVPEDSDGLLRESVR
jgi:hypothetical protein